MRADHAEHRQEPLGCAGGAEACHGAFAVPGRPVRLRPVEVSRLPVADRRHDLPMRHRVTAELVGDQHPIRRALPLEEFAEEPRGGRGVPARLDQDVEDVAVLIDGRPQLLPTAVDRQEHLVEMPPVAGSGSAAAQPAGVLRPELDTPLPDRLVADDHAADQHELLDLTEAQREAVIQPYAVRDDLHRIPVALVRHLAHAIPLRRIDSEIIHFGRTNHQPDNAALVELVRAIPATTAPEYLLTGAGLQTLP